jgi:nucleoside 2-deoxyribosyltransferase
MRRRIYLASPLFSEAERGTNELLCRVLERWCDVFLPQRDGHLLPDLIARGMAVKSAYALVFKKDLQAIETCDVVIANLDGRTIDEGAAFELGFAHARGKTCVGYRTDVRVLLEWGLNPMIVAPLVEIFRTVAELEMWVANYVQARDRCLPIVATAGH